MSISKLNSRIDIITQISQKDNEGFAIRQNNIIASVRASRVENQGTEKSANNAAFSSVTATFKFRKFPNVKVTTKHSIICDDVRYNIISVKEIRGMWVEAVTTMHEGSVK